VFADVGGGFLVVCGVEDGGVGSGGSEGLGDLWVDFDGLEGLLLVVSVIVVGESEGVNPQISHRMFSSCT
jgi:hypothetical protein